MAIYRLLQNSPFGPEQIAVLTDAYERTLRKLNLVDRNDPITEMIARKIIELGQRGVREAKQLSELTIKELGVGQDGADLL
jgi:DNA integrity scanning protein DisA with diadenylate cyclase activity